MQTGWAASSCSYWTSHRYIEQIVRKQASSFITFSPKFNRNLIIRINIIVRESYFFILAFAILFFLEVVYFHIAKRYNILDIPNERSSHNRPTIRGGGIIFILGIILWAIFNFSIYPWFVIGAILISIVSFIDDIHSVPNRYRIVIHFISIILLLYQCGLIVLSGWGILITIAAIIVATGIINAFNFMDGINGITGCYSLAALIPLLYLNHNYEFVLDKLILVVIASILVFCFFNFRKRARCFAGDVGSVTIAFVIIFLIGRLIAKTHDISYIMFLAVYGVDSIMTIIHRIYLRENIFEAHRKHVYQLLANELKIPHLVVSTTYFTIQLMVSLGLIFITFNKTLYCLLVLFLLTVVYWIIIKLFFYLHIKNEKLR